MALEDLLTCKKKEECDVEITEELLREHLDKYRELIAYWRMYPDRLVDYYCSLNPDNEFHFYFYQRFFLRAVMRHRYAYAVFCRAYSKSFLSVLALMLKAILYPGAQLFTVSEGKQQSAEILSSKITQWCELVPAIANEINWDTRGNISSTKTRQSKDSVIYTFYNGSTIKNIAMTDATRGSRFQAGLMEEAATLDQEKLQSIVIPTMNVSRRVKGEVDPKEPLNQSQIYVTSAGYKNTFAYEKLIQLLCMCVAKPQEAFIFGGDWRIPVIEGLLPKSFVADLKDEGTFNEATFDREYESNWTGNIESAFFSSEIIDKRRTLKLVEKKPNGRNNSKTYYILGVDVGRHGCTSEVMVIKVSPANSGVPFKEVVNIFSFDSEHFGTQAICLKKIFNQYACRAAVIDCNGIGTGLVDFLLIDQEDPVTGETLYNWGVINDPDRIYKKYETPNTIPKAMYLMKANAPLNSEMYSYCQAQFRNGKVKLLIDSSEAKATLMNQSQGQKMSAQRRAEYLQPYVKTDVLREEMLNLVEESEGLNIILKPASRKIKHDKFSALIYGLYYCKLQEDRKRGRASRNLSEFLMFTRHQ
jgi:hypothetical protein